MRCLEENDGAYCVDSPVVLEFFDGSGGERTVVVANTYQKTIRHCCLIQSGKIYLPALAMITSS